MSHIRWAIVTTYDNYTACICATAISRGETADPWSTFRRKFKNAAKKGRNSLKKTRISCGAELKAGRDTAKYHLH